MRRESVLLGYIVGRLSGNQELPSCNFYSPSGSQCHRGGRLLRLAAIKPSVQFVRRISSPWLPSSTILHLSSTTMRSAQQIAESLWKPELRFDSAWKDPKHRALWRGEPVQTAGELTAP